MAQQIFYGVWLDGQGWLKRDGEYIAFDNKEIALQTQRRIGRGACVYFIDGALADLEVYFLELERQKAARGIRQTLARWADRLRAK